MPASAGSSPSSETEAWSCYCCYPKDVAFLNVVEVDGWSFSRVVSLSPLSLSPAPTSLPTCAETCLPQEERPARGLTPGRGVDFLFLFDILFFVADFKIISNIQKHFKNGRNSLEQFESK